MRIWLTVRLVSFLRFPVTVIIILCVSVEEKKVLKAGLYKVLKLKLDFEWEENDMASEKFMS